MSLIKLARADIQLGKPLEYAIYTETKQLLLQRGQIINSPDLLAKVREMGVFREDGVGRPKTQGLLMSVKPKLTDEEEALPERTDSADRDEVPFPSLRKGVEAFQLSALTDNDAANAPFRVAYLGVMKDVSIIVTPLTGFPVDALREGQELNAKMFSGRHIYEFRTIVAKICVEPFEYLHLSYPSRVRQIPVRQHIRVEADVVAKMLTNGLQPQLHEARLSDISLIGAGATSSSSVFEVGERIKISFKLHSGGWDRPVALTTVIRNKRVEEGLTRYGLEFVSMPHESRSTIRNYLFETVTQTVIPD
ncbi:flagellar brake protein [Pararobbsia silviterrae]|uniref:Flagellar brake protein n=1 Tax=Pararobbsia silviterrae TaxID=1792498 RepID=A0A494YDD1_9BURK|nr:PilZ domain-containing protein [Pararobbsia silviterrae]RKP58728.1 flagellar brake protein [Pararobbsia silviterrae]